MTDLGQHEPTEISGVVDIEDIMQKLAEHQGCGTSSEGGKASCGSSDGPADMAPEIWEKVKNHPCYSEEAHHHYARMHVAVAPACNIQCNYCNRKYDCANESRPGVVSEKLTPEQAAKKVLAVASTIPQMTVLGIAGPGDPLANPAKTFKTFELIQQTAPDIKLCLSTNGLRLPEFIDDIARYNVDHVTITINMVDPEIGQHIYPWIFWDHKRIEGYEAARILSEQQLRGLEMLTERGILAKINSVMIPGVNDRHLVEVNRAVKSRGAFLHNIMPLISAPEHGTVFGLTGQRGPTAQELKQLQDDCEGEMNMMRHCRQCRADAVGLLGEDRSAEFTTDKIMEMEVAYDAEGRKAYQQAVEGERLAKVEAREAELATLGEAESDVKLLVAVATKGHGVINEHFGHAREFQIYELSTAGAKFVGHRRVDQYCKGGYGEEDSLDTVILAINDCHAVFVAKIGGCPKADLTAAGIMPIDEFAHDYIEKSAIAWFKTYLEKVEAGEIVHAVRGDAAIRQGRIFHRRLKDAMMEELIGPGAELQDAILAHPLLGGGLPEAAARHLRRAAETYQLTDVAETHLAAAEEMAPTHLAVLIAHYRFNFYKGRLAEALAIARICIARALTENRLDSDWRKVRAGDAAFGEWDALLPRFLLFSLKGYAYLSMRLAEYEEGRRAVAKLIELDPRDRIGARVLMDVLDRMEEEADE